MLASQAKLTRLEQDINMISKMFSVQSLTYPSYLQQKQLEFNLKMHMKSFPNAPRQFRENFAKLIQQRLDSGFIRCSLSAFASPSFIIPKVDKNILPRWVCDYRQLNANMVIGLVSA